MADDVVKEKKPAPFWWPGMQGFLALSIVVLIGGVVFVLITRPATIEGGTRDLLILVVGVLLGSFKDVYQFVFGSSKSAETQSENMAQSAKKLADQVLPPLAAEKVVFWWDVLTSDEKAAINGAEATDATVKMFIATSEVGRAKPEHLDHLVAKGLLTQERATAIKAA